MAQLSERLQALVSAIAEHPTRYESIWDTCCDHGKLGLALLKADLTPRLHFNDCVESLIDALAGKLENVDPQRWQLHCQSAESLNLSGSTTPLLIVIAGVGGELAAYIVEQLTHAHPEQQFDFLICPVHHSYFLRGQLIGLKYQLHSEQLIEERGRFYELLHVTRSPAAPLTPTGHDIWLHPNASVYQQKLINHYQRQAHSPSRHGFNPLKDYQQIPKHKKNR